jgi:hypothetical protein
MWYDQESRGRKKLKNGIIGVMSNVKERREKS